MKRFKHLALGGTFDLLHKGHRAFLNFAFDNADKVSIGITTDDYAKKSGKTDVSPFLVRIAELKKFLSEKEFLDFANIIYLDDVYGSTVSDETVDGLLVTNDTAGGGKVIGDKRKVLGIIPLAVIVQPLVMADDGKILSSTRIRQGLIDRGGKSYAAVLLNNDYLITDELRKELSKPQGKLTKGGLYGKGQILLPLRLLPDRDQDDTLIIAVGDEVTKAFIGQGITPDLSIVDFKTQRRQKYKSLDDLGFEDDQKSVQVKNNPGPISRELSKAVLDFFANSLSVILERSDRISNNRSYRPQSGLQDDEKWNVIVVDGEEDLAVLPVVLLAPLGTNVFYGQRNEGAVYIKVTEEKKKRFLEILAKFKVSSSS